MAGLFRSWMGGPHPRPSLEDLRDQLFNKTGYCLLREFCTVQDSVEIRRFWYRYPLAVAPKGYWPGRENYAMEGPTTVQRYECMFWNAPEHPLTYELAWSAMLLRNVVWGLPAYSNIFAFEHFACSYRLTRSDAGDPGVRPHRDVENRETLTHRIQVSVALSSVGEDFLGGGTRLSTRSGDTVNIHETHSVKSGDLILFDQLLEHSVDPVTHSDPADPLSGHWRLLMPDHPIGSHPSHLPGRRFVDRWLGRR